MKYEIEENVLNAIINYFAGRPYREVYEIMPILQNAKPVGESESVKPEISA